MIECEWKLKYAGGVGIKIPADLIECLLRLVCERKMP